MKKALLAQQLKLLLLDHLKPGMTPGVIFFFLLLFQWQELRQRKGFIQGHGAEETGIEPPALPVFPGLSCCSQPSRRWPCN